MKILWAPWRMLYITKASKEKGCFICKAAKAPENPDNLVVDLSKHSIAILNRYPYNNGHLLVAPLRHIPSLEDMNEDEILDLNILLKKMLRLLKQKYRPDGFNIGANLGRVAGAGLPGHFHLHIVPRWNGDTNFMPVLSETKVLPENLKSCWEKLSRFRK